MQDTQSSYERVNVRLWLAAVATLLTTPLVASADWTKDRPFDAIVAGVDADGHPLHVCRAPYEGSLQPGKTRSDWQSCNFGFAGSEVVVSTFETLKPNWVATSGGDATGGFQLGDEAPDSRHRPGAPLYACRARFDGGIQVGKVRPGLGGCSIPYAGREILLSSYEVFGAIDGVDSEVAVIEAADGRLPPLAIVAGYEADETPLYICLAAFEGGLHPGKTRSDWGSCDIGWGGAEHWIAQYMVVTPSFVPTSQRGNVVEIIAGRDLDNQPLGICSASYEGSTQVGKLLDSGSCSFGYGGIEVILHPAMFMSRYIYGKL